MENLEAVQGECTVSPALLVVEDERVARTELARILRGRKYTVVTASDGSSAIMKAEKEGFGIVLMDIMLGDDERDGIDIAEEIQRLHPLTSFIFVSAHSPDDYYRQRIRRSGVRFGGWVEKPLNPPELVLLVEQERQKLQVLVKVESARIRGLDPISYLQALYDLDPSVPRSVLEELCQEFAAEPSSTLESVQGTGEDLAMQLNAEIDMVYDQIWSIIEGHADVSEADLLARVGELRKRLYDLQEREADEMERQFRSQLQFAPSEGRLLIEETRRLLKRP